MQLAVHLRQNFCGIDRCLFGGDRLVVRLTVRLIVRLVIRLFPGSRRRIDRRWLRVRMHPANRQPGQQQQQTQGQTPPHPYPCHLLALCAMLVVILPYRPSLYRSALLTA